MNNESKRLELTPELITVIGTLAGSFLANILQSMNFHASKKSLLVVSLAMQTAFDQLVIEAAQAERGSSADEMEEMKKEIEQLKKEIEELKNKK